MKAREVKKKLLHNYQEKVKAYKNTISKNVQDMAIRQAEIRQLEEILDNCFEIEEFCDFNFVYDTTNTKKEVT